MLTFSKGTLAAIACTTVLIAPACKRGLGGSRRGSRVERLKALQGTWESPARNRQKATTTFELTASGTS